MEKENFDLHFAIAEYRSLRAEIEQRSQLDHAIQRNVILASGAVLSWVFSRDEITPMLGIVLLLIPAMLYVALVQQARHKAYGKRIGSYIKLIEGFAYSKSDLKGWEHFLDEEREDEANKLPSTFYSSYLEFLRYALSGKSTRSGKEGHSLSATVVDNRYLGGGVVVFSAIAAIYFIASLIA